MKEFCQDQVDKATEGGDMDNWDKQSHNWQRRGWEEKRGRGDFGGFERAVEEVGAPEERSDGPSGERGSPELRKAGEAQEAREERERTEGVLERMQAEVAELTERGSEPSS